MSSHPGSTMKDAVQMAIWLKKWGYSPEQVQDFYPTPGTISTVMYYTGIHPMTGQKVYVTTDYREKKLQRALLQFSKPENANLVREALKLAGREDLIGNGPECLVRHAFGQGSEARFTPRASLKKKTSSPSSVRGRSGGQNGKKTYPNTVKSKKATPKKAKIGSFVQKNSNNVTGKAKKHKK